jgi:hypothetical protein
MHGLSHILWGREYARMIYLYKHSSNKISGKAFIPQKQRK